MQDMAGEAFAATGRLAALADGISPEKLQKALEETSGAFERSVLELRRLCEKHSPGMGGYGKRPVLPRMETAGFVERFGYGWLHIQMNMLLPHCRYQTPEWLSDTIRRLLDEYEAGGSKLPFFQEAMLVIDEYCGIDGHQAHLLRRGLSLPAIPGPPALLRRHRRGTAPDHVRAGLPPEAHPGRSERVVSAIRESRLGRSFSGDALCHGGGHGPPAAGRRRFHRPAGRPPADRRRRLERPGRGRPVSSIPG